MITNGTSAGGALSALLGATGNHADYEPYLRALGAAEERDDVFASSCYCPVTNLTHFDAAHEWQFCGINDYVTGHEDVRTGTLNQEACRDSAELKAQFTAYVNSLELMGPDGTALTLDQDGNGSFRDYVAGCVAASAQRELDRGAVLPDLPWLRVEHGRVVSVDLFGLSKEGGRIKLAPGFDHLEMDSPENELFGTETQNARHFTAFSQARSKAGGAMAGKRELHLMNPMEYIGTPGCTAAKHWRIRHGTKDSALAIQTLLALKLRNAGFEVDFFMPWELRHDGDYDLDELFDWVQRICQEGPAR